MLFYSLRAPCLQCRLCGLRDIVVSPFVCVVLFSRGRWFFLLACVWGLRGVGIAVACVKAGSALRSSRAVPHPTTNRALRRLTSEVGRDPVHSTRYGRQRTLGSLPNNVSRTKHPEHCSTLDVPREFVECLSKVVHTIGGIQNRHRSTGAWLRRCLQGGVGKEKVGSLPRTIAIWRTSSWKTRKDEKERMGEGVGGVGWGSGLGLGKVRRESKKALKR